LLIDISPLLTNLPHYGQLFYKSSGEMSNGF